MPWNTLEMEDGRVQVLLGLLAAHVEQRHEQAGEEDADRVQPAHEGDDHGGEAVAGGDVLGDLAHGPGHLGHPGDARHRPPTSMPIQIGALGGESRVARRRSRPGRPPSSGSR